MHRRRTHLLATLLRILHPLDGGILVKDRLEWVVVFDDAKTLVANGCQLVSEGANMPTDLDGIHAFQEAAILYAPSKAANAGGVAVSGLEMSQNSSRISWDEEELDKLLKNTMLTIHDSCVEYGKKGDRIDYLAGANIAGFIKVADAMLDQGVV